MDWETLEKQCADCTACPLHKTRTNCVFGVGNRNAELMLVGEAPGEQEDLSGTPFVGRAGQLLDKFLLAVGIPRENVYIANILKCRPPQNRDPQPDEEDACIGYLREQVRLIRPRVIVCLGRVSAMRLIKPDFRITKEHGEWFEKGSYLMTAVYHPAYLLRDPRKKEDMLTDMKRIREKLEEMREKEA
ncbi:MAG: uracil-DNA glycosylase [Clostridia bacterium]|nr:uracil-DNA glycosylase [Clostridia bacterium]